MPGTRVIGNVFLYAMHGCVSAYASELHVCQVPVETRSSSVRTGVRHPPPFELLDHTLFIFFNVGRLPNFNHTLFAFYLILFYLKTGLDGDGPAQSP